MDANSPRWSKIIPWAALVAVLAVVWLLTVLHDPKGDVEPMGSPPRADPDQTGASSPLLRGGAPAREPTVEQPVPEATVAVSVLHADGTPARDAVVRIHQAPSERHAAGGVSAGVAVMTDEHGRTEIPTRTFDDWGAIVADAVHAASGEVSERSIGISRDGPNALRLTQGVRILGQVVGVPASIGPQVEVLAYGTSWPEFPGVRRVAVGEDLTFELVVPPGYMSLQAVCTGFVPSELWKATVDGSTPEMSVTLTLGGPGVEGRFKIVLGGPEEPVSRMPSGAVVLVGPVGRGVVPFALGEDEWLEVPNLEPGKDAWVHVVPSRADGAWATASTLVRVPHDSWRRGAVVHTQRAASARFRVVDEHGEPLAAFHLVVRHRQKRAESVGPTLLGRTDARGEWEPFAARATPVGDFEVRDCTGALLWEGYVGADGSTTTITSTSLRLKVHLLSSAGVPLRTPNVVLQFAEGPDTDPSPLWSASFEDSAELEVWYPPKDSLTLVATERWIRVQRFPISEFMGMDALEVRTSSDASGADFMVHYEGGAPADGQLTLVRASPVRDAIYMIPMTAGEAHIEGAAPGEYELRAESANRAPLKVLSSRQVELPRGASVDLKVVVTRPRGP